MLHRIQAVPLPGQQQDLCGEVIESWGEHCFAFQSPRLLQEVRGEDMKDVQELPLEQVMFVCKAGALAHPMP